MKIRPKQHRIDLRNGGCGFQLFGLFFAGFGGLFMLMLVFDSASVEVNGRAGTLGDIWVPGIFVLVGLGITGFRKRSWIDLRSRVKFTTQGWFSYLRTEREALGAVERVVLARERRESGDSTHTAFPIYLVSPGNRVELTAGLNQVRARQDAERVARLFDIPLEDTREGVPVVREVADLDQSVVEQLDPAALGARRPVGSRIHIQRQGQGLQIRVANRSSLLLAFGVLLLVAVIPLAVWRFTLGPEPSLGGSYSLGQTAKVYAPPFIYTGLVLAVLAVVGSFRGWLAQRITATPEVLRIRGRSVKASDVEEVHVVDGKRSERHLRITTDYVNLRVAQGLTEEDLHYLRAQILRGLRG